MAGGLLKSLCLDHALRDSDSDSEGLDINTCLQKALHVILMCSLGWEPLVGLIRGSRDLRSQRQCLLPHMYLKLGYSALKFCLNFSLTQILWLYFWFLQVASWLCWSSCWSGVAATSSLSYPGPRVWHFPQDLFGWVLWVPMSCECIVNKAACYRLEC